jgi:NTE family protein
MLDVLASSINIMQVLITPLLAGLELMEFHRASIAIDAGRRAVEAALPQLRARLIGADES